MVTRAFEKAGFTLVRHNNHPIWRCPCGHTQVAASGSPGRGRATANTMAQITRTLRACTPQQRSKAA